MLRATGGFNPSNFTGVFNEAAPVTVASAATTAIGAAASNNVDISGTTTITAFDTVAAGIRRHGRFTGALILTHNGTSLLLPGEMNRTTVANDRYEALSLGSGNWIVTSYTPVNGKLTIAGGKSPNINFSADFSGTDGTTLTFPLVNAAIGFLNIPQNSKSAAYTTVLGDSGYHILHPTADNNARTFTIDSNANVAYAIGTAIMFINQINTVTIAITTDTLTFTDGTTGSRTLAANGIATAVKVAATAWVISGVGLT